MAVTAQRRLVTQDVRKFGSGRESFDIPDLTQIQTESYERFLQYNGAARPRSGRIEGLEGVLQEIFPIESYDKTIKLEYIRYELGKPRYTPDECRQLRLTYGRPFRVWLRLHQGPAGRGRGLPRRHADHDRRRRVHHQRRRARRRESSCTARPASTSSSRSDRRAASCTPAASSPSAAAGSRSTSPRRTALARPHRPERQVLGDDAAAGDGARVLGPTPTSCARSTPSTRQKVVDGRSAGKIEGKVAVDDVIDPADTTAGEIIIESGQRDHQERRRDHLHERA